MIRGRGGAWVVVLLTLGCGKAPVVATEVAPVSPPAPSSQSRPEPPPEVSAAPSVAPLPPRSAAPATPPVPSSSSSRATPEPEPESPPLDCEKAEICTPGDFPRDKNGRGIMKPNHTVNCNHDPCGPTDVCITPASATRRRPAFSHTGPRGARLTFGCYPIPRQCGTPPNVEHDCLRQYFGLKCHRGYYVHIDVGDYPSVTCEPID